MRITRRLIDELERSGAFDEEKFHCKIYKESCIDSWHVALGYKKDMSVVIGDDSELDMALLQALMFVTRNPKYYKRK